MKCMEKYCSTEPEYNYKTSTNPAYCTKHKKTGMVLKSYLCTIL